MQQKLNPEAFGSMESIQTPEEKQNIKEILLNDITALGGDLENIGINLPDGEEYEDLRDNFSALQNEMQEISEEITKNGYTKELRDRVDNIQIQIMDLDSDVFFISKGKVEEKAIEKAREKIGAVSQEHINYLLGEKKGSKIIEKFEIDLMKLQDQFDQTDPSMQKINSQILSLNSHMDLLKKAFSMAERLGNLSGSNQSEKQINLENTLGQSITIIENELDTLKKLISEKMPVAEVDKIFEALSLEVEVEALKPASKLSEQEIDMLLGGSGKGPQEQYLGNDWNRPEAL